MQCSSGKLWVLALTRTTHPNTAEYQVHPLKAALSQQDIAPRQTTKTAQDWPENEKTR